MLLSFLLQKLAIVVIVCTDDDDDDRDKDKDEANESINPSAVVILESAHLLGRLKRPHRCNMFFSFEGIIKIFHWCSTKKQLHAEVVLPSSLKNI